MKIFNFFKKKIKNLFWKNCTHSSINHLENNNYCPDCGKRIKISWISIKCCNCKSIRAAKVNKEGNIIPAKNFCAECGAKKWFTTKKENAVPSEYFYSIPVKEVVKDEFITPNDKNAAKTDVWVEHVNKYQYKNTGNIIKARKRG